MAPAIAGRYLLDRPHLLRHAARELGPAGQPVAPVAHSAIRLGVALPRGVRCRPGALGAPLVAPTPAQDARLGTAARSGGRPRRRRLLRLGCTWTALLRGGYPRLPLLPGGPDCRLLRGNGAQLRRLPRPDARRALARGMVPSAAPRVILGSRPHN